MSDSIGKSRQADAILTDAMIAAGAECLRQFGEIGWNTSTRTLRMITESILQAAEAERSGPSEIEPRTGHQPIA